MDRQTDIPLAANVLGTMGTVLWCVQIVPQIWKNWKLKSTDGMPGLMFFLWAICLTATMLFSLDGANNSKAKYRRAPMPLFRYGRLVKPKNVCPDASKNWNIPMQIQPQSLCFFALVAFSQTLVYHKSVRHQRNIKRNTDSKQRLGDLACMCGHFCHRRGFCRLGNSPRLNLEGIEMFFGHYASTPC